MSTTNMSSAFHGLSAQDWPGFFKGLQALGIYA